MAAFLINQEEEPKEPETPAEPETPPEGTDLDPDEKEKEEVPV